VPDQIITASTSIVGTDVVIDWDAPDDNYETISEYSIAFTASNGDQVSSIDHCVGTETDLLSNTECSIPMASLISLTGQS
jgi:hypothetical protein